MLSHSPSSHVSLVTIDPAVAKEIRSIQAAPRQRHNGSNRSQDIKPRQLANVVGHKRSVSAPKGHEHKTSNTLRRVKDSTEILRQRTYRTERKPTQLETISDNKVGRNFTVTNVGTGGMLYLRPATNKPLPQSAPLPKSNISTSPALLSSTSTFVKENTIYIGTRQLGSDSSLSDARPESPISKPPVAATANPLPKNRPSLHIRSHSFSTIEEHRKSLAVPHDRTLRIVIQRPGQSQPSSLEESKSNVLPLLEIPIPHYRIGTPRFSTHGTPILRPSIYTTHSAAATETDIALAQGTRNPQPPLSSMKAFDKLREIGIGQDYSSAATKPRLPVPPPLNTTESQASIAQPIRSGIFDELAELYDDPSVVKYSQNVREITGATPARIVAQISSESFMDYDLVSDFFLTFRLYMSPRSVLNLLLARLRWAIGRLEDDGRIIRIRTFAALRHWILNYFLDDFVVDRALRVKFCDEINRLHNEVKARREGGYSDLKIVRDLKRCWNGRCLLYWDSDYFALDTNQDLDIMPGGIVGNRDPAIADAAADYFNRDGAVPGVQVASTQSWFGKPPISIANPIAQHQKPSALSPDLPDSRRSDKSLQPYSCSIPIKAVLSPGTSYGDWQKANQIRVQRANQAPPSPAFSQHSATAGPSQRHKRGASSIDSIREKETKEPSSTLLWSQSYTGSIARGQACPPSSPFVEMTPAVRNATHRAGLSASSIDTGRQLHSGTNSHPPIVKNIFGSIRRALSSKQGDNHVAVLTISLPRPQENATRANMSKSQEEFQRSSSSPHRGQVRIDLLCAAALESYEMHFQRANGTKAKRFFLGQQPNQGASLAILPSKEPQRPVPEPEKLRSQRFASHATAQSGSILIVDDTGPDVPAMSGGLGLPVAMTSGQSLSAPILSATLQQTYSYGNSSTSSHGLRDIATQRSSGVLGNDPAQPVAVDIGLGINVTGKYEAKPAQYYNAATVTPQESEIRPFENTSANSSAVTIRNRTAHESSTEGGETATALTSPQKDDDDEDTVEPTLQSHTLRRRPGGDLRKAENIQDLESVTHHESFDSVTAHSERDQECLLLMKAAINPPKHLAPDSKVSMINTHSSQHLRPSFEAAVAGFQEIPDDDDGGLEATLLKLEGRYEKMSPEMDEYRADVASQRQSAPNFATTSVFMDDEEQPVAESIRSVRRHSQQDGRNDETVLGATTFMPPDVPGYRDHEAMSRKSSIFGLPTESVVSEGDLEEMPLFKRGTAVIPPEQSPERPVTRTGPQDGNDAFRVFAKHTQQARPEAENEAADDVRELMQGLPPRPHTANASNTGSFLLDEDEDLSDLSSEISVDIIHTPAARSLSPMLAAPGTAISGLEVPSHPLTYASAVNVSAHHHSVERYQNMLRGPPTPEDSPQMVQKPMDDTEAEIEKGAHVREAGRNGSTSTQILPGPAHFPFLLACDSQLLAQQFTLIEKSALTEIEWSDLVEMRWDNKPSNSLDWAEYLTTPDIKGVDLVITRFNLVVKWVSSEIVLTQNINERARVITKYIHVAAHARRLHNYATMLQITIALTSTDCTRLKKTWKLVSDPDRSLLKNMEALVQPNRNFHNLRLEMESADLTGGCIPFIGLYVHDLTYNAQKPAQITNRRGSDPLINFDRYRTAAVIVKGLLRLIDASSKYDFTPVDGVIERCLWMATLPDDRIRATSKALEEA